MATLGAVVWREYPHLVQRAPAGKLLPIEARGRPKALGQFGPTRGDQASHFRPYGGGEATVLADCRMNCHRPEKDTRRSKSLPMRAGHLNGLVIVAALLISTAPLYAQRQQQNVAKLKADARNLVGIIGSDKTKTQTYCQIDDLSEQLIQAIQNKDRKKANALAEKIIELYKKMGPEFAALIDIKKRVDLNSPDGQEIASIVASLGESCPH
jgi:hypothetical protein